jgi:hypothetical protein
LRELQDHIVDPAAAAAMRGGHWQIEPYGPGIDTLPPVVGNNRNMQVAAQQYTPTIRGLPYYNSPPDASGTVYQVGSAFYPVSDAYAEIINVKLVCGGPNGSSNPISASQGTFQLFGSSGTWVLNNLEVDTANGLFSYAAFASFTIALYAVKISGSGYLAFAGSKLLNIDNREGSIGPNGSTPDEIMNKVWQAQTARIVYSNLTTNITPSTSAGGGKLTRVPVPNLASYTMPADRKGYYQLYRQEEANVGKSYMYLNGVYVVWLDVEAGGNSGVFPIPLNPGDTVQITGATGSATSMYAEVFMYPVGANAWN